MEIIYFPLCVIGFPEGNCSAEKIIVYIVAVDKIVIIADYTDLTYDLDLCAQLLLELTADSSVKVLALFHTAAGGLDKDSLPEAVVSDGSHEIKIPKIVKDDGSYYITVVIDIVKGPFTVFKLDSDFFWCFHNCPPWRNICRAVVLLL